jgi:hypothetical protein
MIRREFVGAAAAASQVGWAQGAKKKIACLSSTYHVRSHSDNFITRFLEGYWVHERYYEPQFQVASLWMDQIHPGDIGGRLAQAYGAKRASSIADALTLGTGKLAVDGVVIIGEHGKYPRNEKRQILYPRYEWFKEIVKVFEASGRAVPVFNDKHLSTTWERCAEMVADAHRLKFPFLAGSSLPVTRRLPAVDVPPGAPLRDGDEVALVLPVSGG